MIQNMPIALQLFSVRDELAADLEELDAERDRLVEATRKLSTSYVPEDDDFVDEVDEDERLTPEEVDEEIADIYEEFNERKALRQDAFDAFMKIEPKQLVPDEALYREMRLNYRDYFTGGMGAESVRDLLDAMDLAASFSPRILVERAVEHLREINCAVLGDYESARPSACEEPAGADEILSYRDKYLSGGKGKAGGDKGGMSSLKRRCPADIPEELAQRVRHLAVDTFRALGCSGVARIDFLNDTLSGALWVNEINTIPGSLSFYLWEAAGLPFDRLLDRMIELAFKRQRERAALTFSYDTNILDSVSLGGVKGAKGGN